jgi:hypothetical protein
MERLFFLFQMLSRPLVPGEETEEQVHGKNWYRRNWTDCQGTC